MKRNLRFLMLIILAVFSVIKSASAAYPLPYMGNETWWMSQDWYNSYSHGGEAALDFNIGTSSYDEGRPALSSCAGEIVHADWTYNSYGDPTGYGRVVLVQCSDTIYQRIAHLKSIYVTEGQQVSEGTVLGLVGGSGDGYDNRWSTHIHYNFLSSDRYPGAGTDSVEYDGEWKVNGTYNSGHLDPGCNADYAQSWCYFTSTNDSVITSRYDTALITTNPRNGGTSIQLGTPSSDGIHWWDGQYYDETNAPDSLSNGYAQTLYIQDYDNGGCDEAWQPVLPALPRRIHRHAGWYQPGHLTEVSQPLRALCSWSDGRWFLGSADLVSLRRSLRIPGCA